MDINELQASLPAALRYTRDESIVEMQGSIETLLNKAARQVQTKNHLQTKQVQEEYNLPLLAGIFQYFQLQVADLIRWVQGAFIEGGGETTVGIPADDADAMLNALEELHELCSTHMLEEYREHALDLIGGVQDMVNELSLEEDAEDEDDEDDSPLLEAAPTGSVRLGNGSVAVPIESRDENPAEDDDILL